MVLRLPGLIVACAPSKVRRLRQAQMFFRAICQRITIRGADPHKRWGADRGSAPRPEISFPRNNPSARLPGGRSAETLAIRRRDGSSKSGAYPVWALVLALRLPRPVVCRRLAVGAATSVQTSRMVPLGVLRFLDRKRSCAFAQQVGDCADGASRGTRTAGRSPWSRGRHQGPRDHRRAKLVHHLRACPR